MSFRSSVVRWCVGSALVLGAVGCAGRKSIPADARDEVNGSGIIFWTATDSGNVYLLDADKNKKVYQGHIRKGEQISVDPAQDRVRLAGDNVDHSDALKPDHRYHVYFKPTG